MEYFFFLLSSRIPCLFLSPTHNMSPFIRPSQNPRWLYLSCQNCDHIQQIVCREVKTDNMLLIRNNRNPQGIRTLRDESQFRTSGLIEILLTSKGIQRKNIKNHRVFTRVP